jgi:hypothetical protein
VSKRTGHPLSPGILAPKMSRYLTPAGSLQAVTGSALGCVVKSFVSGAVAAVAFFFLEELSGVMGPARLVLSEACGSAALNTTGRTNVQSLPVVETLNQFFRLVG